MAGKRNVIWAMAATLGIFSVSSAVLAEEFTEMAPIIGNVNLTSVGAEVIIPNFTNNDTNANGSADSLSFRYDIYQNNTNIKLYSTTQNTAPYVDPASLCTNPIWQNTEWNPKFIRSGKWMITGIRMSTSCGTNESGEKDIENIFVYVADVSKPLGAVRSIVLKGTHMIGMDLVDYNGDGKQDLMVTIEVRQPNGAANVRVQVMNPMTLATISNKSYPVASGDNLQ